MSYQIAISIINFRTPELTIACAQSALDDMGDLNGHVVLVDNASGDGSVETLRAWIDASPDSDKLTLVTSETNSGFSGGHNQGMAAIEASFYLLLNSDSVLKKGCLKALCEAASKDPKTGIVCPQIETEDGEIQVNCFRFASVASEFIRGAGSGPVTRLLRRHVVDLPPPVVPDEIEWASFACVLLKAEMVRSIGPMDEGYFLYFEDAEYCLRARRAGWSICHVPDAKMIHFRGGSGPVKAMQKARKKLPAYYYASRSRFFWHRYGTFGAFAANVAWFAGRGLQQVRRLAGKSVAPMNEHEATDIWINALSPNGPRYAPQEYQQ